MPSPLLCPKECWGMGQARDRNCGKHWTPWMLLAPYQALSSTSAYSKHAFCCLGAPRSRSCSPLPSSAAHSLNNKGGAATLRAGHRAAALPWGISCLMPCGISCLISTKMWRCLLPTAWRLSLVSPVKAREAPLGN